jgi:glycosyltransferase involved in cell wall biosynthesis
MKVIQIIDVRWYNACADFAVKQALGLQLCGHDVLLLANPGTPPAAKAREAGLDVKEEIDFRGAGRIFRSARLLSELARAFDADIIMAHRGESHLIGALAARNLRTRLARFRGDVRLAKGDIFSRWLNTRMTDGIGVSSEKLRLDYLRKYRLDGVPVRVIYPATEVELFHDELNKPALREKFGIPRDQFVVGIVGRFSPVKGHRYFIEAAKIVSLKNPDVQFVIAGGDAQLTEDDLRVRAVALKVPNLHIFGQLEKINELMAAFDVGVIASTGSEMICRVLLEYFASGLPAVATAVNQVSELMLASKGGILVPPADSVALANAIVALLESPELHARYRQNAVKWIEGRSLAALGRETAEFFGEVLGA